MFKHSSVIFDISALLIGCLLTMGLDGTGNAIAAILVFGVLIFIFIAKPLLTKSGTVTENHHIISPFENKFDFNPKYSSQ